MPNPDPIFLHFIKNINTSNKSDSGCPLPFIFFTYLKIELFCHLFLLFSLCEGKRVQSINLIKDNYQFISKSWSGGNARFWSSPQVCDRPEFRSGDQIGTSLIWRYIFMSNSCWKSVLLYKSDVSLNQSHNQYSCLLLFKY